MENNKYYTPMMTFREWCLVKFCGKKPKKKRVIKKVYGGRIN